MRYSLDTNVCIALINGNHPSVRHRFSQALIAQEMICLSSIVLSELWYGVQNSSKVDENTLTLKRFMAGRMQFLPFETGDAEVAGNVRFELKLAGRPIGPYDLLIAAQAKARGMTLVTHNNSEFERISGLAIENWQT